MKRSPELRDLSEEHHYGLVAARGLRLAAEGVRPLEPALAEFLSAWEREIQPHFRSEEELVLPEFARAAGAADPLIVRTLVEHVRIRALVRDLRSASGEERLRLAGDLSASLHDHIRFEERELFPAVEAALAGERLAALGDELSRVARTCLRPAG
jgi:hypothetical protein